MKFSTAYLFAVIDIPSSRVFQTLILSDERPTMTMATRAYGLLTSAHGRNYEDARKNLLKMLDNGLYWRWAKELLPNEVLPGTVRIGRNRVT